MEVDELAKNLVRAEREAKAAFATITKLLKDLNILKEENEQLKATIARLSNELV